MGVGVAYEIYLLNVDVVLLEVSEQHQDFNAVWA